MKNKIRAICTGLLVGLCVANLGCTLMSLFMGELWTMNILYETDVMVVLMSVTAGLILKKGVSPLEKWIRRGAVILLWCAAYPLCLYLFGHFNRTCGHTNYEFLLKVVGVTTPIMIGVLIICYLIGDRLEKKHIDRINNRLSENSFFESFTNDALLVNTTKIYSVYSFEYDNIKYTILNVLKKASNHTVVRLEGENIMWEQSYPLGNRPAKDEWVIAKKNFAEKGTVGMIVFNGTPLRICGLDENGYVSVNKKVKTDRDVYVLTCEELKTFEP